MAELLRVERLSAGYGEGVVLQDKEGLQIMHVLGKNMAWILHCLEAGKNAGVPKPAAEEKIKTNFIRS